jgi:hypothetical protein
MATLTIDGTMRCGPLALSKNPGEGADTIIWARVSDVYSGSRGHNMHIICTFIMQAAMQEHAVATSLTRSTPQAA